METLTLSQEFFTFDVRVKNQAIGTAKEFLKSICPDLAKIIAAIFANFSNAENSNGQKVIKEQAEMTVSDIAAKADMPYQKVANSMSTIKEMGFFQFTKVRGGLLVEFNLPRYLEVLALVKRCFKDGKIKCSQMPKVLVIGKSRRNAYADFLKRYGLQAYTFATEGFEYVKRVMRRKPKPAPQPVTEPQPMVDEQDFAEIEVFDWSAVEIEVGEIPDFVTQPQSQQEVEDFPNFSVLEEDYDFGDVPSYVMEGCSSEPLEAKEAVAPQLSSEMAYHVNLCANHTEMFERYIQGQCGKDKRFNVYSNSTKFKVPLPKGHTIDCVIAIDNTQLHEFRHMDFGKHTLAINAAKTTPFVIQAIQTHIQSGRESLTGQDLIDLCTSHQPSDPYFKHSEKKFDDSQLDLRDLLDAVSTEQPEPVPVPTPEPAPEPEPVAKVSPLIAHRDKVEKQIEALLAIDANERTTEDKVRLEDLRNELEWLRKFQNEGKIV